MPTYPGDFKVFSNKTNFTTIVDASHPNELQDEVLAVQQALGKNPMVSTTVGASSVFDATSKTYASLAARLANIEGGITGDVHTQYLRRVGNATSRVVLTATAAGDVPLTVAGVTGQTANILEARDAASAAPLLSLAANGAFTVGATRAATLTSGGSAATTLQDGTIAAVLAATAAAARVLLLRGVAGQTGNLLEAQAVSGTASGAVVARLTPTGAIASARGVHAGNSDADHQERAALSAYSLSLTHPTAVVRALANQTSRVQEWQAADATPVASVGVTGQAAFTSLRVAIAANSATDPQQWSNGATLVAKVDPFGHVRAGVSSAGTGTGADLLIDSFFS